MADIWHLSIAGTARLHRAEGSEVALRPKERAVLAALAATGSDGSDARHLATALWGDEAPATALASTRNHLSRLRRAAPGVVRSDGNRYRLGDTVEVIAPEDDERDGPPFADLQPTAAVVAARQHWSERRRRSRCQHGRQLLSNGRLAEALADLAVWSALDPDDIELRRLHARALAADGRLREALDVVADGQRRAAAAGLPPDVELNDLARLVIEGGPTVRALALDPSTSPSDALAHSRVGLDEPLAHLDRLRLAGSDIVVIRGPAGAGKSTFVDAALARFREAGDICLSTVCSTRPVVPLEPIASIVEQVAMRRPDAFGRIDGVAALRPLLPALPLWNETPTAPTGPTPSPETIARLCADVMTTITPAAVIVIDDAHWATPMTADLLVQMFRALSGSGVTGIVTTRRATDVFDGAGDAIELSAWDLDTLRRYVGLVSNDKRWVDDAARWIHVQSGGNPLFTRELLDPLVRARQTRTPFVPPTDTSPLLDAQLRSVIHGLSEPAQHDLGVAAILGRTFRLSDFEKIATGLPDSLSELVDRDVVRLLADGAAQLRHDAIHDIVLADLPVGHRVELHDAAFRAIHETDDADGRVDELAMHALGAAALDPDRAIEMGSRSLGREAVELDLGSAVELARRLEAMIAERDDSASNVGVSNSIRLGQLLRDLGDPGATELLTQAAERALAGGLQSLLATALVELCRLGPLSVAGDIDRAAAELHGRAAARIDEPEALVRLAVAGIMLHTHGGDADEVRRWFEIGLQTIEQHEVSAKWSSDLLASATLVLTEPHELEHRRQIQRTLSDRASVTGRLDERWDALHLDMSTAMMTGDRASMDARLDLLDELSSRMAQVQRRWEFLNWSAAVATIDGELERAERLAESALGFSGQIAESLVTSAYGAHLVAIRHRDDRLGELFDMIEPIVNGGTTIGAWHAAFAAAAARGGRFDVAADVVARITADEECSFLARDPLRSAGLLLAAEAAVAVEHFDACHTLLNCLRPWQGLWAFAETTALGPVAPAIASLEEMVAS